MSQSEADPSFVPTVIPPSPTSFELGRYGQIPVGLYTGTPNVSIPLHTIKTKNFEIPISLSYNSNGIKVDQIASWVGMGWSLNAGGIVTRVVKGIEDEYPANLSIPAYINILCNNTLDFLEEVWNDYYDTEPDMFSYNFNGYSGKFVIFHRGTTNFWEVKQIPQTNLKIEVNADNNYGNLLLFKITTPDGIIYKFGGSLHETSKSLNTSAGCSRSFNREITTTWHLFSIEQPNIETITFEYELPHEYTYYTGINQSVTVYNYTDPVACVNPPECNNSWVEKTCRQALQVKTFRLKKIITDVEEISFISSLSTRTDLSDYRLDRVEITDKINQQKKAIQLNYFNSNSIGPINSYNDLEQLGHRLFLESVYFYDSDNKFDSKYKLDYNFPNDLPRRLSTAQDHWGYFNNNFTNYYVPNQPDYGSYFTGIDGNKSINHTVAINGLLSKITYPTKGYSEFEYEANTINKTITSTPPIISGAVNVIGLNYNDPNSTSLNINISEIQTVKITVELTSTCNPVSPNHHFATISLWCAETGGTVLFSANIKPGNQTLIKYLQIPSGSYTLTLTSNGACISSYALIEYYDGIATNSIQAVPTGGFRVKRIISSESPNQSNNEIKRYYYENGELLSGQPIYVSQHRVRNSCPLVFCGYYDCYYLTLQNNTINSLYDAHGNEIAYQKVTTSYGGDNFENGGEESVFSLIKDAAGEIIWGEGNFPQATKSNRSWNNGTLLNNKVFKMNNTNRIVLKETQYSYYDDPRNDQSTFGFAFRKLYDNTCDYPVTITCNETLQNTIISSYCGANHRHNWLLGLNNWHSGIRCIAPGAFEELEYHPCHDAALGTIMYSGSILNYDVIKYSIFSKWNVLQSKVEKSFDQNGANPVTTTFEYQYDNPLHGLPTRVTVNRSDGLNQVTTYKYPLDYDCSGPVDEQSLAIAQLVARHQLNTLVEERTYLADNSTESFGTIGANCTIFKKHGDVVLPDMKLQIPLNQPLNSFTNSTINGGTFSKDGRYEERIFFDSYDNDYNLIEFHEKDNVPHSVIYNDQIDKKPIAYTKNAVLSEIGYTGFENQSSNQWTLGNNNFFVSDKGLAKTGTYSLEVRPGIGPYATFTIPPNIASNHAAYKASVWVKGSPSAFLRIEILNDPGNYREIVNTSPETEWHLLEIEFPKEKFPSGDFTFKVSVRVDGGTTQAYFDDIRFHPSDAEMTTVTYHPKWGSVSSQSDSRNRPTIYEYDASGRLYIVRDHEGNIIKKYEYQYRTDY